MAVKRVRIRGMDELAKKLKAHGVDVQNALEKITLVAAEVIRADAESKSDGEFKIGKEVRPDQKNRVRVVIGPEKDEWYAVFREFGASAHEIKPKKKSGKMALLIGGDTPRARANHPGITPRPFLRPAADERREDAKAAAAVEMKRVTGI